jgi:uncharacterized membrane protein YedE/YeeE
VTTAILATATGLALGILMARGRVCFNAGVRRAVVSRDSTILRVFAVAVAVQLLLLPLLLALGVDPLSANVDAGAPALFPVSQLIGGLTFGVGMALAGGCITGILWKAGAGSVATAIAIVGFVAGELVIRGPLDSLLTGLDDASRPATSSVAELTGVPYPVLAIALGVLALVLLARRSRTGLVLGAGFGLIAALAWVAADVSGYGYGLGFVGAAEGTRGAIDSGGSFPFQLFLALGVLAGGTIAVRGPLRSLDGARAGRALAGGVLMGFGGNLAHGCNIGHGVTGVPLLSLGSLLAVGAMGVGAVLTWRYLLAPLPKLRGFERPEAVGW